MNTFRSRTAIDNLAWLIDEAFEGDLSHSLLAIMIAHDFYHAGEINHLRALLQGTDRWPYD